MKLFYEIRSKRVFIGPMCPVPFPLHVHVVCEMVYLFKGSAKLTVGGGTYTLSPGDTIIAFPSVAHSYDEVSEDAEGLCVVFPADNISEFANTIRSMRPVSPLFPAEKAPKQMHETAEILRKLSQDPSSPLLMAYFHVLLAHLMSNMPMTPLSENMDTNLIQQVLQYVADHFDEPLTLESVSASLGISKSHLSRLFSLYLNINFRRYINILRIDQACTLLKASDLNITEICYACGFNNLRTFHRAFMDEIGIQPKDYRTRETTPHLVADLDEPQK